MPSLLADGDMERSRQDLHLHDLALQASALLFSHATNRPAQTLQVLAHFPSSSRIEASVSVLGKRRWGESNAWR